MPGPRRGVYSGGGAWSHRGVCSWGVPAPGGVPGPGRLYAKGDLLQGECGDPPLRSLLLRAVRILLECILV